VHALPAHLRRDRVDNLYFASGFAAFALCLGVHWALYARAAPGLRLADLDQRRAALLRYFKWLAGWEAAVLIAAVAYLVLTRTTAPAGLAWIAPAVGALLGNALPLQLAALVISRAGR
jgi:hypothetical protein